MAAPRINVKMSAINTQVFFIPKANEFYKIHGGPKKTKLLKSPILLGFECFAITVIITT